MNAYRSVVCALAFLPLVLTGCAGKMHVTHGTASHAIQPNNVGVVTYGVEQKSTDHRLSDGCIDGIVKAGTHAIERERVGDAVKDGGVATTSEPSPQDVQKVGKAVQADGMIIETAQGHMDLVVNRFMVTSYSARLVEISSGEEIRGVNFSDLESQDDGFLVASEACQKLMESR